MTRDEAKKRIEKLKEVISHHRYLYHVLDRQEISDAALDSLKHELKKLEEEYPEFITPDSPTQRMGGKPLEKFGKVRHRAPMLSLEDTFSSDELEEWRNRIQKLAPHEKLDFFAELKIDGFAISLIYKNGFLVTGSTRGDGVIGENVSQNLKTIESIPMRLRIPREAELKNLGFNAKQRETLIRVVEKGEVEVRGEVYMTKKSFENINRERKKKGESLYANPRNIAAGSIRQLNPKIVASRPLTFLAYDLVTDLGQETHSEEHKICCFLGFKTDSYARYCENIDEVVLFWEEINKKRGRLSNEIDGIVVNINNNKLFQKIGVVGKAPRGSIAFKFPAKEATTAVKDIIIQIGRTGTITPVAVLEPVQVGGVIVTRATLHNEDEIKRLGIKVGDTVIVQRAGDVIPDIVRVLPKLRTGKEKIFKMPDKCPVCGGKAARLKGEVSHRCLNKNCSARKRENLYHFVSKKSFNVVGLGPKIINELADNGLIQDAADIYNLEEGDLVPLERFAEKSAKNLVEAIDKSKDITLAKFIYALGILHVGEETSQLLAKQVIAKQKTKNLPQPLRRGALLRRVASRLDPATLSRKRIILEKLKINDLIDFFQNLSEEELRQIPDVGLVVGKSIYDWFHTKKNLEFLEKLEKAGIRIKNQELRIKNQELKSKSFVFTGELENMTRDDAKAKVREFGGDISSSVSSKTDFVVAGREPGSKLQKAQKLGVKVISEKDFLEMIRI